MTETALAIRDIPSAVVLTERQLEFIAKTEFVPKAFRGNLPAIMACVATGRSIGISDMSALRSIHVVEGKATFSAELMVQLVRAHGHSITGEVSSTKAVVRGRRIDNGDEMTCTWTWEDAQRAGLANRPNWKSYPDDMLWSRAVSRLCRRLFADCFAGATYTPEEGEYTADEMLDEPQDSVGEPQADETSDVVRPAESSVSEADAANVEPPSPADTPAPSAAQLKKLNVLVGQLREAGRITNEQLWRSTAREPVASEDGQVHWSPLRDMLTKQEASDLIERLQKYADQSVRDSEPVAN